MFFGEMFEKPEEPGKIIEKNGWVQISDENEIKELVKRIVEANPQSVADFKRRKRKSIRILSRASNEGDKRKGKSWNAKSNV